MAGWESVTVSKFISDCMCNPYHITYMCIHHMLSVHAYCLLSPSSVRVPT